MNKTLKNHCGLTILEILVGILLSSFIFAGIFQLVLSSRNLLTSELKDFRKNTITYTLKELLRNELTESINYNFMLNYKIHPLGKIIDIYEKTLSPGKINSSSSAITIIKFHKDFLLTKDTKSDNPEHFCMTALSNEEIKKIKQKVSDTTHWIAITVDGYYQSSSTQPRFRGNSRCKSSHDIEISLSRESQEMFGLTNLTNKRPFSLIAVDECFTIYLDDKNMIRRISHISKENQPMMRDVLNLNFKEEQGLLTELTFVDKKILTFKTATPTKTKGHYLDFIL